MIGSNRPVFDVTRYRAQHNALKSSQEENVTRWLEVFEKTGPGKRSEDQLMSLDDLIDKVQFFRNLQPEQCHALFQLCDVRKLHYGEVLFRQGDVGNALYVVLKGKLNVKVRLARKASSKALADHKKMSLKRKSSQRHGLKRKQTKEEMEADTMSAEQREQALIEKYATEQVVAKIGELRAFGELALHSADGKRRAGVVAASDQVVLLEINRRDYERSLKRWKARITRDRVAFLKKTHTFRFCTDEDLAKIVGSVRVCTYSPGQVIVRQGDAGTGEIFLVQAGECAVRRTAMWVDLLLRRRVARRGEQNDAVRARIREIRAAQDKEAKRKAEGDGHHSALSPRSRKLNHAAKKHSQTATMAGIKAMSAADRLRRIMSSGTLVRKTFNPEEKLAKKKRLLQEYRLRFVDGAAGRRRRERRRSMRGKDMGQFDVPRSPPGSPKKAVAKPLDDVQRACKVKRTARHGLDGDRGTLATGGEDASVMAGLGAGTTIKRRRHSLFGGAELIDGGGGISDAAGKGKSAQHQRHGTFVKGKISARRTVATAGHKTGGGASRWENQFGGGDAADKEQELAVVRRTQALIESPWTVEIGRKTVYDSFGEAELLGLAPRYASSVVATQHTRVLALYKSDLKQILEHRLAGALSRSDLLPDALLFSLGEENIAFLKNLWADVLATPQDDDDDDSDRGSNDDADGDKDDDLKLDEDDADARAVEGDLDDLDDVLNLGAKPTTPGGGGGVVGGSGSAAAATDVGTPDVPNRRKLQLRRHSSAMDVNEEQKAAAVFAARAAEANAELAGEAPPPSKISGGKRTLQRHASARARMTDVAGAVDEKDLELAKNVMARYLQEAAMQPKLRKRYSSRCMIEHQTAAILGIVKFKKGIGAEGGGGGGRAEDGGAGGGAAAPSPLKARRPKTRGGDHKALSTREIAALTRRMAAQGRSARAVRVAPATPGVEAVRQQHRRPSWLKVKAELRASGGGLGGRKARGGEDGGGGKERGGRESAGAGGGIDPATGRERPAWNVGTVAAPWLEHAHELGSGKSPRRPATAAAAGGAQGSPLPAGRGRTLRPATTSPRARGEADNNNVPPTTPKSPAKKKKKPNDAANWEDSVGSLKEIPAEDRPAAWRPDEDVDAAAAEQDEAGRTDAEKDLYVPTLNQLMTFAARATMISDDMVLDRLDASAAWQRYKRHFFLGTTTAELVRESHWAKAWGREHAKEAIEQRRLENPNLRFKPKPNTEAPHGDDVEISEQLSRFCSGLNAVHSDYVGVYRPYKQREARAREDMREAAIADARSNYNRRGSELATEVRPTILGMMFGAKAGQKGGRQAVGDVWTASDHAQFDGKLAVARHKHSSTGSMVTDKARSKRNLAKLKMATRKAITARFALSALSAARKVTPEQRAAQSRARARRLSDPTQLL